MDKTSLVNRNHAARQNDLLPWADPYIAQLFATLPRASDQQRKKDSPVDRRERIEQRNIWEC